MGGGDFDDGLGDLGEPGGDVEGDLGGSEGGENLEGMDTEAPGPLNESVGAKNPWETLDSYVSALKKNDSLKFESIPIISKALRINESVEKMLDGMKSEYKDKKSNELEEAIAALEE